MLAVKRLLTRGWLVIVLALVGCGAPAHSSGAARPTSTAAVRLNPTVMPTFTAPAGGTLSPTDVSSSGCRWLPLVSGQHLSASGSYTQSEQEAAGAMVCRIQPDSCAYHYLIGDLNPALVFKREEDASHAYEDFLVHPAMLAPLARLDALVQTEWGGRLQLRITDAYDSQLEHDLTQIDPSRRISLHFEGRSVDLTTWPQESGDYGQLCALAICAGFDWVQDEGDHCHASIRAESLCLRCKK
jgi:hypothetical protein